MTKKEFNKRLGKFTMKDEFIEKIDRSLASQQEVYHWLASTLYPREKEKICTLTEAFFMREQKGSIQIDEGVILPHIENKLILQSKIIILNLKEPIKQWSNKIGQVHLILFVLLSTDTPIERKQKMIHFIQKLADETFIQTLKRGDKL